MPRGIPEKILLSPRRVGDLDDLRFWGGEWARADYCFLREVQVERVLAFLRKHLSGWLPIRTHSTIEFDGKVMVGLMKNRTRVFKRLFHYSPSDNRESIQKRGLLARVPEISDPRNVPYRGVYLFTQIFDMLEGDLECQHEVDKWDKWMVLGETEVYIDHEWNWPQGYSYHLPAYRSPVSIPPKKLKLVWEGELL